MNTLKLFRCYICGLPTFIVKFDELSFSIGVLNLADCAFELADELDEIIEGGALLRIVAVVGDPPGTPELEHPILCFNCNITKKLDIL